MISKQEKAKINQIYRKSPMQCSNCKFFEFETENVVNDFGTFQIKKKFRCGIGKFKVLKTAVCGRWELNK